MLRRILLSIAASLLFASVAFAETPTRVAVPDFELNDLTLDPGNAAEIERAASIKPLLEKALNEAHHATVAVDPAAQSAADRGVGYLFDLMMVLTSESIVRDVSSLKGFEPLRLPPRYLFCCDVSWIAGRQRIFKRLSE